LPALKGIERYKYLQDVNVSGNNLTTLKPLSAIKHLIKLNASYNALTTILDFSPPANLEWADFSRN